MKKLLRFIFGFVSLFVLILLLVLASFYLMAPVYEFSGPVSFTGDKMYNPYQNMKAGEWKMYNFQVQSEAWGGLTDGRENSNELIDSIYNTLGFDWVATSDYQKINKYKKDNPGFIPTYEHGYNINRTHQVCIGAKEVVWTDFVLFQTLNMKQWVIDLLNEHSEIVALAHPLLNDSYKLKDMNYLTNYQMLEVLSNLFLSIEHWDVALSGGQLVWALGNDDAHNVRNVGEVARKFTLINAPTINQHEVIQQLKDGNNIAVDFFSDEQMTLIKKTETLKSLPELERAELVGDTFRVSFSRLARVISFIGENGKTLKTIKGVKSAEYIIQPNDPYVRTEVRFNYDLTFYLNPVVRYEGETPKSVKTAQVNTTATLRLRIVYFLIFLSLAFLYTKWRQRKPKT